MQTYFVWVNNVNNVNNGFIKADMSWVSAPLSGYTFTYFCLDSNHPFTSLIMESPAINIFLLLLASALILSLCLDCSFIFLPWASFTFALDFILALCSQSNGIDLDSAEDPFWLLTWGSRCSGFWPWTRPAPRLGFTLDQLRGCSWIRDSFWSLTAAFDGTSFLCDTFPLKIW